MADTSAEVPPDDRLDSWKDIAAYLRREVRTVQLWEKTEGLPVHRHTHRNRNTVYAYRSEIDSWSAGRTSGEQRPAPLPLPRRQWPVTVTGLLTLSFACAAVGIVMARRPVPVPEPANILPLTSDPGNEMGASFSPDGNQVAFAWKPDGKLDFDVYVKAVGSDKTIQLTDTADSDEVNPAWSPDGSEIAFYRAQADGRCGIYTLVRSAGRSDVPLR